MSESDDDTDDNWKDVTSKEKSNYQKSKVQGPSCPSMIAGSQPKIKNLEDDSSDEDENYQTLLNKEKALNFHSSYSKSNSTGGSDKALNFYRSYSNNNSTDGSVKDTNTGKRKQTTQNPNGSKRYVPIMLRGKFRGNRKADKKQRLERLSKTPEQKQQEKEEKK